ncbi:DUF6624 domain-containing protein [Streptomyces griseoincarnatus]
MTATACTTCRRRQPSPPRPAPGRARRRAVNRSCIRTCSTLTARHGDRLGEVVDQHGWPAAGLVGEEAARAAWLTAQHADRRLDVQRRALRLREQAVEAGKASPRDLAFLRDRTLVNEGRKQMYGTQIAGVKDGSPVPWPCEHPERTDALRAEVGIEPFADYVDEHAPA